MDDTSSKTSTIKPIDTWPIIPKRSHRVALALHMMLTRNITAAAKANAMSADRASGTICV